MITIKLKNIFKICNYKAYRVKSMENTNNINVFDHNALLLPEQKIFKSKFVESLK